MLYRYDHPYATEIGKLSYPEAVHTIAEPLPYLPPSENEAIFVDTKEGVEKMLAELRTASEIAIDLEHHDTHSYVGIVCLMQISTRHKDWIVDTLVPWREDLQILNEVFTDPKILKVFQGSTMDMIWLQRDLGLYVVGLFDTFHASTALGFPQKSLKYLLERFCNFHANKKYQMADWRIRPIPVDLLEYARSDTHYLLYIYDNLRNMLLEASSSDNSLIDYVLQESKREALQRYERAVYDVEKGLGSVSWFTPLTRRSVRFTPEQFGVYRAVHEWRDQTARALDEGPMSIMSQAILFTVAEAMPTNVPALMKTTSPVSKAIKDASRELIQTIKTGQIAGREGPTVAETMRENENFLPRRRNQKRQAEREQPDQGVGSTLQMLNESGDVISSGERSLTSQFWGATAQPLANTADQSMIPLNDALRVVLPFPISDAISFISPAQPGSLERAVDVIVQPALPVDDLTVKSNSDNVFILKELDRVPKRKVKEANVESNEISSPTSGLHSNADYSHLGTLTIDSAAARAETKERKRDEKRRKKAAREVEANHETTVEPFDYTSANSVLHAKPDRNQSNGSAGEQQRFNPYAKSLDGPQGLRRLRKETAGKSFTFKK